MLFAAAAPAAACPGADADPAAAGAVPTIEATICLINAERGAQGRGPVRWNARLQTAAQAMAEELTRKRFFAHVTPDRRNLLDRVRPTGYTARVDEWALGENLAWGAGNLSTPRSIVAGWMASSSHRSIALDREFAEVGVAISPGTPHGQHLDGMFYVADFGYEVQPRPKRKAKRAGSHRSRRARAR